MAESIAAEPNWLYPYEIINVPDLSVDLHGRPATPVATNTSGVMMSFSENQIESLSRTLRIGDYSLLLRAGASFGGKNGNGLDLPLGDDFRQELCTLKQARPSPLQKIYETLTEDEVKTHVVDRFFNCTPSFTLNSIPQFIWRRIFSLNIDDALENAYRQTNQYQECVSRNYKDIYQEERDTTFASIIHLHGWVRRPEQGYIFSREAYIRQMRTMNPWMVVLSQSLAVDPFIIMGTSLDEVDLDFYLAHRTQVSVRSDRGPSVLVEISNDIITQKDCEKYNLVHFPGTSEDFMKFLLRTIGHRPLPRDLIASTSRELFPKVVETRSLIKFFADFSVVPSIASPNLDDSRFFRGHEPTWNDLASQLDVSRDQTQSIISSIEDIWADITDHPTILYLRDDPGTGKTTIVRRIAYEFARQGITVLNCSALSQLESSFTSSMLDLIDGRLLVMVDNFADQAYAVADILKRLEKKDVVFVVSERRYRDRYIMQAVAGLEVILREGCPLTVREAERLVDTYSQIGLVGASTAISNKSGFVDQIKSDPIAVACCRIMNDLRPLDGIIDSLIRACTKTDLNRYLTAAIAHHCITSGLRYDLMVSVAGGVGLQKQLLPSHPLPLTFPEEEHKNYLVPLNGTIASRLLRRIAVGDPTRLLDTFIRLAKAVAPRVNRRTIQQRSPEARLAGRLFDFDQVVVEFLGDMAEKFYTKVRSEWLWNSRYWEQVALLHLSKYQGDRNSAAGLENLELAMHHARHAVSIERHPLTLTTLGKILLAGMNASNAAPGATFQEAFALLTEAINAERARLRSNAQPYVSLFRGVREFVGLGIDLDSRQRTLLAEYVSYARVAFSHDREIQNVIDGISSA